MCLLHRTQYCYSMYDMLGVHLLWEGCVVYINSDMCVNGRSGKCPKSASGASVTAISTVYSTTTKYYEISPIACVC